jgi:hypothetical protein
MILGFHVGGKTALNWYGVRHYVAQQETLHLYGSVAAKLPAWFVERFAAEYHRKRLFAEPLDRLLHVAPFEDRADGPQVSAPERAMLELLSEVGVRQPLQEAREINGERIQLGREFSLPWIKKLDPAELPTGSERPWVSRSADGLLVLKP